jgi:hypothetical protein
VAIAAVMQAGETLRGKNVLAYATGGNIAFEDFARLIDE